MDDQNVSMTELARRLTAEMGEAAVLTDEPMCRHTTFEIGGPADVLVMPGDAAQVVRALSVCRELDVPVMVVGRGSDLLVGDKGIRGAVVLLAENYANVLVDGRYLHAQAGALLADVARVAAEQGLAGMEPLSGIPGSVGGACFMNAGAYGGETAAVLESVRVLSDDGTVRRLTTAELDMGYRTSRIAKEGLVVLDAVFALERGERGAIEAAMADFQARREEKQPLELPSAGSTFKRPEGYFAGKLIMDSGLRGARVGGAQVSEKHCGFVVNTGGATAADVLALIRHVQDTVEERFGVRLEPEVRLVGEF